VLDPLLDPLVDPLVEAGPRVLVVTHDVVIHAATGEPHTENAAIRPYQPVR
jgi:hypothetical protein